MRVIGIDPGVATTGYAVVERQQGRLRAVALGVIKTSGNRKQAERLLDLRTDLLELISSHSPDQAAVERLFFNANVRTAMSVGQASGVIFSCAAEREVEVFDYTPTEVKSSVVGVGNASKSQVQSMVAALLGLDAVPEPADAADACALAICHLNRAGLQRAIRAASS